MIAPLSRDARTYCTREDDTRRTSGPPLAGRRVAPRSRRRPIPGTLVTSGAPRRGDGPTRTHARRHRRRRPRTNGRETIATSARPRLVDSGRPKLRDPAKTASGGFSVRKSYFFLFIRVEDV